jgi:hypothetical protein
LPSVSSSARSRARRSRTRLPLYNVHVLLRHRALSIALALYSSPIGGIADGCV